MGEQNEERVAVRRADIDRLCEAIAAEFTLALDRVAAYVGRKVTVVR